ncbi:N-acetylmannosamine-6-phosphate 2-epimerase [Salimicrobium salexigens]|uniref:Putative N-acetylmannosamine-6-phosphate 2-epimerase n=1 Tax=Salimicrobium salexigens TaxID=908941 RepID=A0ABY1L340_9BACI|nr:N-acetylmannosamine-6-phosphate 2-epimerase [Salimicrobium salexigens]SIS96179.1 N-acylglucosamine-6-phosphate 2-epimerase [Salimicrobium salexigens]
MEVLDNLKGQLIVSCQALEEEPLHGSETMGKMAKAAREGGARGIRANGVEDIRAIKKEVDLPLIGIIKRVIGESEVFITPTFEEIEKLVREGCDIIAFDATDRMRPDGKSFEEFFTLIKEAFPEQLFMADVSTVEEGLQAEKMGVDLIATTLVGYTPYTEGHEPLDVLKGLTAKASVPVIAEGNYNTEDKARRAVEAGAHAVVVGSAITRPQLITRKFAEALEKEQVTKQEGK